MLNCHELDCKGCPKKDGQKITGTGHILLKIQIKLYIHHLIP